MMERGFRASMLWLHTWSGLVMGWLLFAVFLTGTLVFFRAEIDYWMTPELHQSVPHETSAVTGLRYLAQVAPGAEQWQISLPDDRSRVLEVRWQNPGQRGGRGGPSATLDASTGEVLYGRESAGSRFLYDFHFELYGVPRDVGRAIVGIASLLMFLAIITGVIAHKHIFKDFFSFRTSKSQRGLLDAHALTAVLALPFHIMITFSGLVLLAGTLVFWNNEPRQFRGDNGGREVPVVAAAGEYTLPPIADIITKATSIWDQPVSSIAISKPSQSDSEIRVSPAFGDRFSNGRGGGRSLVFNTEGTLIEQVPTREAENAVTGVYNSLVILHQGRFAAPLLRWLFFIAGVLGTAMVGTGLVFWVQKRKKKQLGHAGFEFVCWLNVGSIAGLCIATVSYFWANRLLPANLANRADWEIRVFFAVWLLAYVHAAFKRHRQGWSQQFWIAGVLALFVPLLDSVTSPVSLWYAWTNSDWLRLGFDLVCVLFAGAFIATASVLQTKTSWLQGGLPKNLKLKGSARRETAGAEL